ncbi:lytic transglycosylase domain-containing protein [Roseomonas sp. OT10]|uniref:lytic transglycosylase domain-containing protein n=1 Tax=Roseomonas cutis TaxID=2897332 RepID=UPI001E560C88|nr:lytic transglycosylase domain-containing protein [Roseomonas sp. OT10]UFN50335.1 lytic transglycosylase domain-containing protein [Roseomonas sp. OT10]
MGAQNTNAVARRPFTLSLHHRRTARVATVMLASLLGSTLPRTGTAQTLPHTPLDLSVTQQPAVPSRGNTLTRSASIRILPATDRRGSWAATPRRQVASLAEAARSARPQPAPQVVLASSSRAARANPLGRSVRLSEIAVAPALRPGQVAGLPQPLAPSDATRLRRAFELQKGGDIAGADREISLLEDRRLVGHLLAERWLAKRTEPSPAQLQSWLAANADHPDAPAIYALLAERSPRGASLPPAPSDATLAATTDIVPEESTPASRAVVRNQTLDRSVRDRAQSGDATAALRLINGTRGMTPAYAALLKGEVAQALFQRGDDTEAFRVAAEAVRNAPGRALPAFVAGLAAWGRGQFDIARPYFEAAARADDAPAVLRAAAAFWTARAAVRARQPQLYVSWMLQAAQEPRTFYGLVARRALGLPPGFAWERDSAAEIEAAALAENAGGWRALALLQVGQKDRAEAELRRLWPAVQGNPMLSRATLAAATQAGMTEFAAQLAGLAQTEDGRPRDFTRFPVPKLEPLNGYRVDPALIYALARQESNFDPRAVSGAGARGLMQVMPATAAFVANDSSLGGPLGAQRLHDPAFSLEIGQRYLHHLAQQEQVKGDLIRVLAGYNAGPGNLQRWQPSNQHRDDPFLFIESIPIDETRNFVQRVLTYSWIYASRLGLPSPSLDALAAGAFPRFTSAEEVARMVRQQGAVRNAAAH